MRYLSLDKVQFLPIKKKRNEKGVNTKKSSQKVSEALWGDVRAKAKAGQPWSARRDLRESDELMYVYNIKE